MFRVTDAALAVVLFAGLVPDAHAIMRRHDVADAEYVVEADEYPALVDLLAPGDCMATLIAPQWLLTAAHCAAHLPADHEILIGGTSHEVDGVVCHPDYRGFEHDIALVRLTTAVTEVTPLAVYRDNDEVGQGVLLVGRGDHGTGKKGQSDARNDGQTREATNTVRAAESEWIEFVFNEPGDSGLTPTEGISGDGDSGGPALIETSTGLQVAGVSSWQDARECKVGEYGVHEFYTRVSSYLSFIDDTTGPDWDGEFRSCTKDEGCRIGAAGATMQGRPRGVPIALACLLLLLRRRPTDPRRKPRRRARHLITSDE